MPVNAWHGQVLSGGEAVSPLLFFSFQRKGNTVEERIFRAHKGSPFTDAQAAIIGPELYRLAEAQAVNADELPTAVIVEEAKRETSPLHPFFTWNVEQAAQERWAEQARAIARSFQVEIVRVDSGRPTTYLVSGMVSVKPKDEDAPTAHVYVPIATAAAEPQYVEQMARQLLASYIQLREKYAYFADRPAFRRFAHVFKATAALEAAAKPPTEKAS